ncbi:cytochrome P450 2B19-like [Liolophura sinensis]|uniref:cytochrome P450 2B19-like n=1 Tax=Liolophura sinensis TaxID=3198878 RepID=UPI003158318C
MDLVTWALMAITLWSVWFLRTRSSPKATNLPPGPAGLPVIGYAWAVFHTFHILFTDLAKKWGDVFHINIFGQDIIVLNSVDVMREAYASQTVSEVFSGRPPPPSTGFSPDINATTAFLPPSPLWVKQRKLLYKILSMYGDGVQSMENTVHDELQHVVDWLKSRGGKPVNMDEVFHPSLINILTILLTGKRHEYGDPILKNAQVMDDSAAVGASARHAVLFTIFPFLKYIPYGPGRVAIALRKSTEQFFKDYYDASKATYDPTVTRGMIDYLLHYQEELREAGDEVWLKDTSIRATIQEVIGAGSITTLGSLNSFFLIIAKHPDVAKKIQEEIDAVIGQDRLSSLKDRTKMPYTMAAIFELLRYISHVPLGLPHLTTDDVMFRGYLIPANITVMANMWLIHHDENNWSTPWEFKPERFLDQEGQLVTAENPKRKALMPFGIGRRSCVGETFARSRIFLYITTLLQSFNFSPDPNSPLPSCDPRDFKPGLVIKPLPFRLKVTERK